MVDLDRHSRHILRPQVGAEGQVKLSKARILCVGAGGLGSPVIPYLAAAGIGHLTIVDDDVYYIIINYCQMTNTRCCKILYYGTSQSASTYTQNTCF